MLRCGKGKLFFYKQISCHHLFIVYNAIEFFGGKNDAFYETATELNAETRAQNDSSNEAEY